MKSLFSFKWYSNPHTIQAEGHETAIIPLSHGAPCIFTSQFVESLVILSPRHLKNLGWLSTMVSISRYCCPGQLFPEGLFSASIIVRPIILFFLELSNLKNLFSLTWDSNTHPIQAQGLETAIIPLSHRAPWTFAGQLMESLVTISSRH